jgi:pimeloyl-ACP methyl ester carboxylesterase
VPVLFLHGLSYTIEIWRHIGVTELLVEKHVPFLALDMPYGMKSHCEPKTRDPQANIEMAKTAIENFSKKAPVVVGASIGGNIALQYAAQNPVKGLLLVAPARAMDETLAQQYSKFQFPVRIIWGTEDNLISGEEMRVLAEKLPHAKLVSYEGAGHSAYQHQPDRFKLDLLELYADAEQQG